jgi:hypothetical protein
MPNARKMFYIVGSGCQGHLTPEPQARCVIGPFVDNFAANMMMAYVNRMEWEKVEILETYSSFDEVVFSVK